MNVLYPYIFNKITKINIEMFQNLHLINFKAYNKAKAALKGLLLMLNMSNYIFIAFDIEINVLLNPKP
jgi:hypothetical protein